MNCGQFEQLVDRYLDGELTGSFKLEFEAHLVACEACGHLVAMMEAVGEIIAEPAPDEPKLGIDFTDRVLADWSHMQARRRRWVGLASGAAAAAAVILVVGALLMLAGPQGGSVPQTSENGVAMIDSQGGADLIHRALAPADENADVVSAENNDEGTPAAIPYSPVSAANVTATLDEHAKIRAELEFHDWFTSTLHDAQNAIAHLRQLPGDAFDELRTALIDAVSGQRMLMRPGVPMPAHSPNALESEPAPVEPLPVDAEYELI